MHFSTIYVPDELMVLVFAYELFDINRVFIEVVLPSDRTLRTTTSLDFFIFVLFSATSLLFCLPYFKSVQFTPANN